MQFIPISRTLIRDIADALLYAGKTRGWRAMRAARYLERRISRQVSAEDMRKIAGVQAGVVSASCTAGPIDGRDVCLGGGTTPRRALVAEARPHYPPLTGWSTRPA